MLVALFWIRSFPKPVSQAGFASELARTAAIYYARSIRENEPAYTTHKTDTALAQDLKRAAGNVDEGSVIEMMHLIFLWRFGSPESGGFYLSNGGAHLYFKPRRPHHIIHWVDRFLTASGDLERTRSAFTRPSRIQN